MNWQRWIGVLAISTLLAVSGCGGGEFKTAKVTGKVTVGGKPVTSGDVMYMPLGMNDQGRSGKAARAQIQKDGTYTLTTYDDFDGAVIGKHQVTLYNPGVPVVNDPNADDDAPVQNSSLTPEELANLKKPKEVEVKSGSNEINLEY